MATLESQGSSERSFTKWIYQPGIKQVDLTHSGPMVVQELDVVAIIGHYCEPPCKNKRQPGGRNMRG